MRLKLPTSRYALAALLCIEPGMLRAEDGQVSRGPESLWETSKDHLKNPLGWPSVWRLTPQVSDPAHSKGWRLDVPLPEVKSPVPQAKASPLQTRRIDWKQSEDARTLRYIKKVGTLQPEEAIDRPVEAPPVTVSNPSNDGPVKYYLSQSLSITTPFLAETDEGGGFLPNEVRLRYNNSNESNILQLYEEVIIGAGAESGVKTGDLYRTYEVGSSYRSFAMGRKLGRLVETNGIVEIIRVSAKNSVGRLIKCFGTISRESRACPLRAPPEVAITGYSSVTDGKQTAQVVWVTQQQQFPQPFSYAIVDRGTAKGYRLGDMVLFYNRTKSHLTEKVLGNGLVVSVQENSATVLIKDIYPGIINRGDYTVVVQTTVL